MGGHEPFVAHCPFSIQLRWPKGRNAGYGSVQLATENASRKHALVFVDHYRTKADANKHTARVLALGSIAGSALIPVLLAASQPAWLVAGLSACVTVATAWLHVRRHGARWALYRSAQRDVERELNDHQFSVGLYRDVAQPDAQLAERVNAIVHRVHYEWEPMARNLQDAVATKS